MVPWDLLKIAANNLQRVPAASCCGKWTRSGW